MLIMYQPYSILYWVGLYDANMKLRFKLRFEGNFEDVNPASTFKCFRDAEACNYPIICLN